MKLIADSGSTKTSWALVGDDKVLTYQTEGINPIHQSEEQIKVVLMAVSQWAAMPVDEVFFYGSGVLKDLEAKVNDVLSSIFTSACYVESSSDLLGAARALLGLQGGIACILGTGANSCLYDGKRIVANTPALGYILGDEGGGAVMGRNLLNGLYKGLLPAWLKEKFETETGLVLGKIIDLVYRQPLPNRWLASLSPFIYKYKEESSELKQMVVNGFTLFVKNNIIPYGKDYSSISAVGSIAWWYQDELRAAAERCGYHVGKILKDPISGMVEFHNKQKN